MVADMTRRTRTTVASLCSFLAGACCALAVASLLGVMQYQDEQEAAIAERVLACSQVAEYCSK